MAFWSTADLDALFDTDEWGSDATYTSPAGAATACRVHVDDGTKLIDGETGELLGTATTIDFRTDEIADPARDATVLVGATTYVVQQVGDRVENIVKCQVRKQ